MADKKILVIVESPAKCKTISGYLNTIPGMKFHLIASYGHIAGLDTKKTPPIPEDDLPRPTWTYTIKGRQQVKEILKLCGSSDEVYIASDRDREGEGIAYHLHEAIRKHYKEIPIKRIVFNAITKPELIQAVSHPVQIDRQAVDAYIARTLLDFAIGFTLSPLLWRYIKGAKSAGRVQSPVLSIIADRESERRKFEPTAYYTIQGTTNKGEELELTHIEEKKIVKPGILEEPIAKKAYNDLANAELKLVSSEVSSRRQAPPPAFTTATLQMTAASALGKAPKQTMEEAQKLYESGFITYMRTDSKNLSQDGIALLQDWMGNKFPYRQNFIRGKQQASAQLAHEAIRPARILKGEGSPLYNLILKRAAATLLEDCVSEVQTTVYETPDKKYRLKGTKSRIVKPGWQVLYGAKPEKDFSAESFSTVKLEKVIKQDLETKPPTLFSQSGLVKVMSDRGLGRPSTYATIIQNLLGRQYVYSEGKQCEATPLGEITSVFLQHYFHNCLNERFTAEMEASLDKIASGKLTSQQVLKTFYDVLRQTKESVAKLQPTEVGSAIISLMAKRKFCQDGPCPKCQKGTLTLFMAAKPFIRCAGNPSCDYIVSCDSENPEDLNEKFLFNFPDGSSLHRKFGQHGAYLVRRYLDDREETINLPGSTIPTTLEEFEKIPKQELLLGVDPKTGEEVILRNTRFGLRLSMSRYSVFIKDENISLELALELLYKKKAKEEILGIDTKGREVYVAPYGRGGKIFKLSNGSYERFLKNKEGLSLENAIDLLKTGKKLKVYKAKNKKK